MYPLYITLIVIAALYIVSSVVFAIIVLKNRSRQKRLKINTKMLLISSKDFFLFIKQQLDQANIDFVFEPVIFPNDDEVFPSQIRENTVQYFEKKSSEVKLLSSSLNNEMKTEVLTFVKAIDDNLLNYRRAILRHNKLVVDYNAYCHTVFFMPVLLIFNINSVDKL